MEKTFRRQTEEGRDGIYSIIIAVANQKGGVGKTTTAHALATGLQEKGFPTLLIDIDPQGNASYTMGADTTGLTIYEVLRGEVSPAEAIQHTEQGDIIASSLLLAGADMEFTQTGREYMLRDAINTLQDDYRAPETEEEEGKGYAFIIIDTPPTLGILTINALATSRDIIIPMGADIYSLQGLGQLNKTINKVIQYCNEGLTVNGLLLTRYNGRSILSKELKEAIDNAADQLGTRLYKSVIREGIAIKEAQTEQASIFTNAPKSNPAIDYMAFIEEYLGTVEELKEEGGQVNNGKERL